MRLICPLGRWVAVAAVVSAAALGATPALGATTGCTPPPLSQPFLGLGDANFYTLAPGGDFASASGGWTLSGGASIIQATQPNGTLGGALDMPSRSTAVSPVMCITTDFPIARAWIRNIAGSEGVSFSVSFNNNGTWTTPKTTGSAKVKNGGWTLSDPLKVAPQKATGWQLARFTFIAKGTTSRFQVDDFWVDPRAL